MMMCMNILLIGSGGREHALAWKIAQSPRCEKLYIAPGNPGTAQHGENVSIGVMEFDTLIAFVREHDIGLTVVGPDDPLGAGIVDALQAAGLRVWGPSRACAQIEASKAFAKELMRDAGIPTAASETFTDYDAALAYVRAHGAPIVIKASGLALGKGVTVCQTLAEAEAALHDAMVKRVHKEAGETVVIEEFMQGIEISIHAMSDGTHYRMFPTSQDHKRIGEGNTGKNTGGMGTIAPLPFVSEAQLREIEEKIVAPVFAEFRRRGTPYVGILYPGVMLTADGPKVFEYNARFGDPETQVYMRLLDSDLLDLIEASVDGTLSEHAPRWRSVYAANVVLASQGYPDAYPKGLPISGIENAEAMEGSTVFHAGTKRAESGSLVTNGGRVLGVSAIGATLDEALDRAYAAADKIQFEGKYVRRDIGRQKSI
jgi:phosphoribosylamine--glycine ligase